MKTEKNILIAFILNLTFSVFEIVGGFFTGSVAITSDAIHDIGDATSIGISYFLERKSKSKPDKNYTYGYSRYSVMGGLITTFILFVGSVFVIINAIEKFINPTEINYSGMIIFAVIGVLVNFCAAYFTSKGESINQRAVNLHMLEDVLGWAVVLVGAIVMHFTNLAIIDPIMSIGVAMFILYNVFKNFKDIFNVFLEKTPDGISVEEIKEHIEEIDALIRKHLDSWEFQRINKVDLAILRISVYPLLYQKDLHPSIVINEAVDISKEYGSDDSFKFVNAVLDNIKKELGGK